MRRPIDVAANAAYGTDVARTKSRTAKKTTTRTTRGLANLVAVRLDDEDFARLAALAERIPVASRHALAREALRLGLTALEREPERLLRGRRRISSR